MSNVSAADQHQNIYLALSLNSSGHYCSVAPPLTDAYSGVYVCVCVMYNGVSQGLSVWSQLHVGPLGS